MISITMERLPPRASGRLRHRLRERIAELKAERGKTQAAYDRAAAQMLPSSSIDPDKIAAFSKLMSDLLEDGETAAHKAYLRTLVGGAIVVGDKTVKIVGSKDALRAAVTGKPDPGQVVRGFVPEWCGQPESNRHSTFAPRDFKSLASTCSAMPA